MNTLTNTFKFQRIIFLINFFIIFSLFSTNSFAQEIISQKNIEVNSDNFDMNIQENVMTFSKNVEIKLGNFKAKCDKSIVYLENKKNKIQKILMIGKVKIEKDNSQINGEKVYFYPDNQRIIVEGNVKTKIVF